MPKALVLMIRKSLKRDVQARYASAQEMLNDLKKQQRRAATKWLRRSVVGGLIGIVLLLVALVFAARYSTSEVWEEKVLRDGHALSVRRAVISPDGRLLVSASDDKTVLVWDFATRKRLKTLTDHTGYVRALAFSADGKRFATGSHDKTVIVWDAMTFEKITTLREHRDAVNAVAFSPDGKWLVGTGGDGDVLFRSLSQGADLTSSSLIQKTHVHQDFGRAVAFSPDGQRLIMGKRDSSVRVYTRHQMRWGQWLD